MGPSGCDFVSGAHAASRLVINHSLLPLSCLPRKKAGEKIRKRTTFGRVLKLKMSLKRGVVPFQRPATAFTEFAPARQGLTSLRYRLIRETKSDLDNDLKFRLTIMDCPADLLNLKPVKIAQSLARLGDCVADSLLNAIAGNAGHLNYFVGLFWHWSLRAEADY
jgi:hypothetical protein